jgi:hypothetical protein
MNKVPILLIFMHWEHIFLASESAMHIGCIPEKELADSPKVLSMNRQDFVGESIVRGIIQWPKKY